VGCSNADAGRIDPQGFVVYGQSDAPQSCGPSGIGELVIRFFETFNSHEIADHIDDFIAPAGRFVWFSVQGAGERLNDDAYQRDSLSSYLQQRADIGEELRLVAMDTEYDRGRDLTNIAYTIQRSAPDIAGGAELVAGKGAIDCESGKIMVWSVGTARGDTEETLCPSAAAVEPDMPVVCLRQSDQS
jgi:hypothetical protein